MKSMTYKNCLVIWVHFWDSDSPHRAIRGHTACTRYSARQLRAPGIEDFKFHDLRHSAASELAMSGASLAEIAAVLGHKTFDMVKRYSHLSEPHTHGVVERMVGKVFG